MTMRDGAPLAALSGDEPIRLYISGGGHRASLGGVGVIGALHHLGRWGDVADVVTVSGGSIVNGALLGQRRDTDGHPPQPGESGGGGSDDPMPALGRFVEALVTDRAGLWRTPRRALALAVTILVVALCVVALAVASVRGPGWFGLLVGLLLVPVVSLVIRRYLSVLTSDVIAIVTDGARVPLTAGGPRRHVFCASGLSSGVPYYFWSGGRRPHTAWGEPVQEGYTVADAVLASSSLPGTTTVRAPHAFRREPLVDGGVSGIFGEQYESTLERDPHHTWRGDHQRLAVDGGRHVMSDRALVQRLGRFSMTYTVLRWLTVSLEATYVNDLADWKAAEVVRLCAVSHEPEHEGDDPEARLGRLRTANSATGLFTLDRDGASVAVTTGAVATLRALTPRCTHDEIVAALSSIGAALGWNDQLVTTWNSVATPTTPDSTAPHTITNDITTNDMTTTQSETP
jgi:hypothetical protein